MYLTSKKGDQMKIKDNGKDIEAISMFEHEEEVFRMERITTRLILAIVIESLVFVTYLIFG